MCDHRLLVSFIVCDSGPAIHFADFTKKLLSNDKLRVDIYTSELAREKFQDLPASNDIQLFNFALDKVNNEEEQSLAQELLKTCLNRGTRTIIIDIANKFNKKVLIAFHELSNLLCNIRCWCYYDNSEEYVPGGYSIRAEETIRLSQNILFANMNLIKRDSKIFSLSNVQIDLHGKNIQGIGYYPINTSEKLYQRRQFEKQILRDKYNWNHIKYVFVYFGGNNQDYYEHAFPTFLSVLSRIDTKLIDDSLFLIHQHPAAKKENRDGLLFRKCFLNHHSVQVALSQLNSDEAQIIADGIIYYQTSMAAQFALIGLPIMQVAHEIYKDILVKHQLCEIATNSTEFINGLKVLKEKIQSGNSIQHKKFIYDAIGYRFNWLENLQNVILNLESVYCGGTN